MTMTSPAIRTALEAHPLYSVPYFTFRPEGSVELADELKGVILDRRGVDQGITVTNRGGWHSAQDLQTWDAPCVVQLVDRIHEFMREVVRHTVADPDDRHLDGWELEAWANVNEHGALNLPHVHTRNGNLWSGVLYVDEGETGDGDHGGRTRFQDRSGVPKEVLTDRDPFGRELTLQPEQGLFIMFPGTAWHAVDTYTGHRPRITIAFNLKHPGFAVPTYEPADFWWTNFRFFMRGRQVVAQRVRDRVRSRRDASGGRRPA